MGIEIQQAFGFSLWESLEDSSKDELGLSSWGVEGSRCINHTYFGASSMHRLKWDLLWAIWSLKVWSTPADVPILEQLPGRGNDLTYYSHYSLGIPPISYLSSAPKAPTKQQGLLLRVFFRAARMRIGWLAFWTK